MAWRVLLVERVGEMCHIFEMGHIWGCGRTEGRYWVNGRKIVNLILSLTMQAAAIKELEKRGNDAVKRLRTAKHEKGLPFMINSKSLPGNQCYLEYPDGHMELVTLKSTTDQDFTLIRVLSVVERNEVLHNFLLR